MEKNTGGVFPGVVCTCLFSSQNAPGGQALNLTPAFQVITRGNARSMQNGPSRRAMKEPCFPSRDEQKGS